MSNTLTNNTTSLPVTDWAGEGLNGPIPKEIGNLDKLRFLDLSGIKDSTLSGKKEITAADSNLAQSGFVSVVESAVSVEGVDAKKNLISGMIPLEIGKLKELEVLRLVDNDLKESIPPEICDCASLVELNVQDNKINGAIPKDIGRLKRLQRLYVVDNWLEGTIPESIGDCLELKALRVGLNKKLGGNIPPTLKKCQQLWMIGVGDTIISDKVPWEDEEMPNLLRIHLPTKGLQILGKLGEDADNVLKVWTAMGGQEQRLKQSAGQDVFKWKNVTIENGRVTELGKWRRRRLCYFFSWCLRGDAQDARQKHALTYTTFVSAFLSLE